MTTSLLIKKQRAIPNFSFLIPNLLRLLLVGGVNDLYEVGGLSSSQSPLQFGTAYRPSLTRFLAPSLRMGFAALMICTKSAGFRRRKVRSVRNTLSGISYSAPLRLLSKWDPLRWAPIWVEMALPIRPPSSSEQSPLCSGRPVGHPSLRSLAPPLPTRPAPLGSRWRR